MNTYRLQKAFVKSVPVFLVMLIAVSGTTRAQTTITGKVIRGVITPVSVLPSTCTPGDVNDTVVVKSGPTLYTCTSTNTYTAVTGSGASGGSGGVAVQSAGVAVPGGVANTFNVLPGTGVTCIPQLVNGVLNFQCNADTAYLATKNGLQGASNPQICTSSSGSGSVYTASCSTTLNGYAATQTLFWYADVANGANPTLNIDTLGAKPLLRQSGSGLVSGDITPGALYRIWYDGSSFRVAEAGAGGGGGGVSAGLSRTINLPSVGCNVAGAGTTFGSVTVTGGITGSCNAYSTADIPSTGAPTMMWQLRWPEDWDNTQPVNVRFAVTNPPYNSGNYQLDFSSACMQAGATYNSPVFDTVLSSGQQPMPSGPTIGDVRVTGLSTAGCGPGGLFYLKVTRNQTVTGNSSGSVSLLNVALTYTAK